MQGIATLSPFGLGPFSRKSIGVALFWLVAAQGIFAANYTNNPVPLNVGDVFVVARDGWTSPPGGSAYDGDVLPKMDTNNGLSGDSRYYRRHNVARAWPTDSGYWFTGSTQNPGEPDPAGPQWVDYVPPFEVLGAGRYVIDAGYRWSSGRATYPAVYRVYHANGMSVSQRDQRLGNVGANIYYLGLGEFEMRPGSFIRVEDTGTQSITFGNARFRLVSKTPTNNQAPVAFVGRLLDLVDDDGDGIAEAILDASRSFDRDGSITNYAWSADRGVSLTNGVTTAGIFPAGQTLVRLVVTDNQGGTNAATVLVSVRRTNEVVAFTPFELSLTASSPGANPYLDGPEVSAVFTGISGQATGLTYTVRGFWDGTAAWRVRFAPTAPGAWTYSTISTDAGLNDQTGNFTCIAATSEQVEANELLGGFLQADGFAWKLSNGKPFLAAGDSQWSFAEEFTLDEFKSWMDALNARGLNVLHGCIWLSLYPRNGVAPFPNGDPTTDLLNPAYFQQLDQMVAYANRRGIMLGLTIGGFPGNSQWWTKFNTIERDDRWFRYCVARYSAFNVRWILFGEVNEANPPWDLWQFEVSHKADLVKGIDPYRHPIGSHHTSVDTDSIYDANIDYLEIQHGPGYKNAIDELALRTYGKPLWAEEYWYSTAFITPIGTAATYENFVKALCFPTIGSWMREHVTVTQGAPTYAQQAGKPLFQWLMESDEGLRRLGDFARFFKGVNTLDFNPMTGLVNRGYCGKFAQDYAIFLPGGGNVTIDLGGAAGQFDVRRLVPDSGLNQQLPAVLGGGFTTLSAGGTNDAAFLLTATASPTLAIEYTSGSCRLSWPASATGFRLWTATNLSPPVSWQLVTQSPGTNGSQLVLSTNIAGAGGFFRLSNE